MTSDRGQSSMEFRHFAPCPHNPSAHAMAKVETLRAAK